MTNLGPLTTVFTPTGPDCTSSFIGLLTDNKWLQYGVGGAASSACLPSSFRPFESYYYSPGVCPEGYTSACQAQSLVSGTKSQTVATCCPSAYSCRPNRGDDPFACWSCFDSTKTFSVSTYYFYIDPDNGQTTRVDSGTTTEAWAGNCIRGYGPIVRMAEGDTFATEAPATTTSGSTSAPTRSDSTITSPTAPVPTTSDEPNSTGLSAGAAAGIGVGSGIAAILIIGAIAFLLMRRRKRAAQAQMQAVPTAPDDSQYPQTYYDPVKVQQPPYELPQQELQPQELSNQERRPYELDASNRE
ncbi:hypothetical protein F5Y04DRAFT_257807 [Hypomontagnella monticulosa]|nr:hypothetical protein F5Y04DRAFT_257807 [Hypomontagnella monticulosa]